MKQSAKGSLKYKILPNIIAHDTASSVAPNLFYN